MSKMRRKRKKQRAKIHFSDFAEKSVLFLPFFSCGFSEKIIVIRNDVDTFLLASRHGAVFRAIHNSPVFSCCIFRVRALCTAFCRFAEPFLRRFYSEFAAVYPAPEMDEKTFLLG